MPLSDNEKMMLSDLFERAHAHWETLNDWEKTFVTDQEKRYEEWGDKMNLSPKQWSVLNKIEDVITNGRSQR